MPELDLSDVKLPDDVADEKAEYGNLYEEEPKEDEDSDNKPDDKEDEDISTDNEESSDEDQEDASDDEEGESDDGNEEDSESSDEGEEDVEEEEEGKNGFHNHPDWQKMQERLDRVESENTYLKGRFDQKNLQQNTEQDDKDQKIIEADPYEVARAALKKDIEGGWKPDDRVEERKRLDRYIDQAKAERTEAVSRRQDRLRTQISGYIDNKLDDMKVSGDKERKAVTEFMSQMRNQGLDIAPTKEGIQGAVEFSVRQLKATGKLEGAKKVKKNDFKQTKDSKDAEKKQREAQRSANKKTGRKKSDGSAGKNKKLSYKYMHSTSLDDLVMEAAKSLD